MRLTNILLFALSFISVPVYSQSNDPVFMFVDKHCDLNDSHTLLVKKLITHESKSYYKSKAQPWPWTLNINGVGHWFSSYESALKAAETAYSNGARRLGVGLGQLEWRYHSHRFENLKQALDPVENIKVVCSIVDEGLNSGISNSYVLAAYYHRPVLDDLAFKYADKVFSND